MHARFFAVLEYPLSCLGFLATTVVLSLSLPPQPEVLALDHTLFPAISQSSDQENTQPQPSNTFEDWETQCYERVGREAIEACDRAIAINANNSGVWLNRGYAQQILNRFNDALASYNQAITLQPNYSLALYNKCTVLHKMQQYAEAIKSCELALKGDQRWGNGNSSLAWNMRGQALEELGRYPEALLSYEQALEVDPNDEISRENIEYLQKKIAELELQQQ